MLFKIRNYVDELTNRFNSSKSLYIVVSFLLLNFVLKIWFIEYKDISHDEPFTIFHAQANWEELWVMLGAETNPPLFFILLHFWIKTFGISALSVRFLPLVFSVLTVIPLYKLSRLFGSKVIAIIILLLFTFSNAHIESAHDTRAYSLFVLLTVFATLELLKILFNGERKYKNFIWLAVYYFLMLYTHHIAFLVGFLHVLIIGINFKPLNKKTIIGFTITGILTLVLYVHYIPIFISAFSDTADEGTCTPIPSSEAIYDMIRYYMNVPVAAILSLIIMFTFIVKALKTSISKIQISLILSFFVLYVFMFMTSNFIVLFVHRYILFLSIPFFIMIALGVKMVSKDCLIRFGIVLMLLLSMFSELDVKTWNHRTIQQISNQIKELQRSNTAIIMVPSWTNHRLMYYYSPSIFKDYNKFDQRLIENDIFSINSLKELNSLDLTGYDRVIYLDGWAEVVDPELKILKELQFKYKTESEDYSHKGYRLLTFESKRQ